MTKTAFVTGATGFLGLNIIQQLTEQGWDVTAFHRPSSHLDYLKRFPVKLVTGELEDRDSLQRAIPEGVDAVFHTAGDVSGWSGHRDRQTRTNVLGTRNTLAAAKFQGARRFLHTSSIIVYGLQPGIFDESAEHLGRGSWINYMRTKCLAEDEVRKAIEEGLDAVILNPANIVGPYDLANWARLFRLVAEDKLPGIPPGEAPFCSVAEVAKAHLVAFERGRTGENYLLGGTQATYLQAFQVVGRLLGHKVPDKPLPALALTIAAQLSDWSSKITRQEPDFTPEMVTMLNASLRCKSEKAERELCFCSVPLETMFTDCYQWLKAEKLL